MKKMISLFMVLAVTALVGCKGGSGGTSTGGVYLSHTQLAQEFVDRLYLDLGYDVQLVKSNTLQYDYIVVYDYDLDTYDAYYIGNYNPGENLNNYLNRYSSEFYYDLIDIGGNQFEDYDTGIIFEKTSVSSKDRLKLAAVEEEMKINRASETLQANYGFEAGRAYEVAKLVSSYEKTPVERRSNKMVDEITKQALGHSYTSMKNADAATLAAQLKDAVEINGILPEQANKLILETIGLEL